jgi:hypothetical protein
MKIALNLRRDFSTLDLSSLASRRKPKQFPSSPLLQAPPALKRALLMTLAFTFLTAASVSAGPQSQRPAPPQFSICKSVRANAIDPPLFLRANLRAYSSIESASCANNFSSLRLSAPSFPNSSKSQTNPDILNTSPKLPIPEHRFWDRKNDLLFAAVGASRALDYSSTLNFRRRGRQEAFLNNDIVDNHPAFAAIEAAGTAVSIAASYLFHRYHHHRLERWMSIVHASLATSGAIRNYCLKTEYPSAAP